MARRNFSEFRYDSFLSEVGRMRCGVLFLLALPLFPTAIWADGPLDNIPEKVRRIPPPGIVLAEVDRQELTQGAADLAQEIADLKQKIAFKPADLKLLPDVQIFHNAVHYALQYDEFFKPGEIAVARNLLKVGRERAALLRKSQKPWTTATGLVVRGYVSKIDGSVQPYGLIVPTTYQPNSAHQHRLDFWFHGRGEVLSELNFLEGRMKSYGEFAPKNAFVLHPYGRYSNANHFAGEVDAFEALDHVRQNYPIDEDRLVVRGFSMGGAACWHYAVHHAWRWAAAAPGAGFSETPDFLRVFQKETLKPTWYQEKLWNWYDCNRWALNLQHCPTVAYSGDKDSQKQAADIMVAAMKKHGMDLVHIIGKGQGHNYDAASKAEINRRIDSIVERGRERVPRLVRFVTYTLRYPRMAWVEVDGLGEHWKEASVQAEMQGTATAASISVQTSNVTGLTLRLEPGDCLFDPTVPIKLVIDGATLEGPRPASDRSWSAQLRRDEGKWRLADPNEDAKTIRKRPGLQGPIDDAFMDSFVMVRPTGQPMNPKLGEWTKQEMAHAVTHWRSQFRGEITPKGDVDVSDADIAGSNLVLWGDPASNKILAKIADKLPIQWTKDGIRVGAKTFGPEQHVAALIAPNPLNPKKYVVLNSGFTYREYDYLNNARQVPRLPDWAILDVLVPATSQQPAGIVNAGFFDEGWKVK